MKPMLPKFLNGQHAVIMNNVMYKFKEKNSQAGPLESKTTL